jgi:hypothetical protein
MESRTSSITTLSPTCGDPASLTRHQEGHTCLSQDTYSAPSELGKLEFLYFSAPSVFPSGNGYNELAESTGGRNEKMEVCWRQGRTSRDADSEPREGGRGSLQHHSAPG